MRVRMFCNGKELFVSPFVGRFTAGVCKAVAGSLKAPTASENIQIELEGDRVQLQIDGTSVLLDKTQGFAETIVSDTIRGMIRHLKDIDPDGAIRIEIELERSHGKDPS